MLTPRQSELMVFLDAYTRAHGGSPSYEEMSKALGGVSKSCIVRIVDALVERGFVRKLGRRGSSRAIEVLVRPILAGGDLGELLEDCLAMYCEEQSVSRLAVIREAVAAYFGLGLSDDEGDGEPEGEAARHDGDPKPRAHGLGTEDADLAERTDHRND